ncbi:MAG: leucine-rich repeat protein [Erysipelotrichaceae bacterium]
METKLDIEFNALYQHPDFCELVAMFRLCILHATGIAMEAETLEYLWFHERDTLLQSCLPLTPAMKREIMQQWRTNSKKLMGEISDQFELYRMHHFPADTFFQITQDGVLYRWDASLPVVVDIPQYCKGVRVREIGPKAFYQKMIHAVSLPMGLERIGVLAFAGNQLEEVQLPLSLQRVESKAFAANTLVSVRVHQHVRMAEDAFDENPSSLQIIELRKQLRNDVNFS